MDHEVCGSSLGVGYGEDSCRIVDNEEEVTA